MAKDSLVDIVCKCGNKVRAVPQAVFFCKKCMKWVKYGASSGKEKRK